MDKKFRVMVETPDGEVVYFEDGNVFLFMNERESCAPLELVLGSRHVGCYQGNFFGVDIFAHLDQMVRLHGKSAVEKAWQLLLDPQYKVTTIVQDRGVSHESV